MSLSRESTDAPDDEVTLGESAGSGDTTAVEAPFSNDFAGVLLALMRLFSSRLRVMLNSLLRSAVMVAIGILFK